MGTQTLCTLYIEKEGSLVPISLEVGSSLQGSALSFLPGVSRESPGSRLATAALDRLFSQLQQAGFTGIGQIFRARDDKGLIGGFCIPLKTPKQETASITERC